MGTASRAPRTPAVGADRPGSAAGCQARPYWPSSRPRSPSLPTGPNERTQHPARREPAPPDRSATDAFAQPPAIPNIPRR
jgi:hypothetical protein